MGAEKPNASLMSECFSSACLATPTLEIRWSRGIWYKTNMSPVTGWLPGSLQLI